MYVFYALIGVAFYGAAVYLILSFGLKSVFLRAHRQGMERVKQHQLADAIPLFVKSVVYFTNHAWLDKYRYLTLLDSSKISYKEMGLSNIAYCYYHTGDTKTAKEYYERLLAEFPENETAKASLTLLNTP